VVDVQSGTHDGRPGDPTKTASPAVGTVVRLGPVRTFSSKTTGLYYSPVGS